MATTSNSVAPANGAGELFVHKGLCDASAAATLDARHFIVADDEKNELWIYDRTIAEPIGAVSFEKFLGIKENEESDVEGAATIGNRIYWISSHGRNKKAAIAPCRHQFFVTEIIREEGKRPTVEPVGKPYHDLLRDLIADEERFEQYNFAAASLIAPKQPGGFNIEGLADTSDGRLLIGLRSPVPQGKALVIPLNNPGELVEQGALPNVIACFDDAIELDLDGRGIRSIERIGAGYWVVAGPTDADGDFSAYRWSGVAGEAPVPLAIPQLDGLHPECLVVTADGKIQILSDDGGKKVGGKACKDLPDEKRSFRSLTITL
jgi:hypothetical protein